ncbi:hypothetical protein FRC11_001366 [Ceratobasidium sp. 423]|nr:hypothetical protein FRC11_001366 [Ceratobasidium sp. 423]
MSDSTAATKPEGETVAGVADPTTTQTTNPASSPGKGKGKGKATADDSMDIDEEDDDEDDDEDDEEEDEDDEGVTEDFSEIDPKSILPQGRTRRTRPEVNYASAEAHAKAGLKPGEGEDDD